MAGIDGIGGGKVDWNALLNSISGDAKVEGGGDVQPRGNLVLSDSDKELLLTLLTTPDIDAPAGGENASETLQSLIDKLQDGKTFNFDEEQTKVFVNTLNAVLAKVNGAANDGKTPETTTDGTTPAYASTTQVMFDLYAMFSLLLECAQEMKNAQRDQRQAEVSTLVNSIQAQADKQRSAAMTGLIAGSIVCAIQVTATIYSTARTISNTKAEANLSDQFGVKTAATQVGQAETTLNEAKTQLADFNAEHPVPAEGAEPEPAEITQQRTQLQQEVEEAKTALAEKRVLFESAKQQMRSSQEFQDLKESQAWTRGIFDITQALGNLGQNLVKGFVDLKLADATAMAADQKKAEDYLEQTRDLMGSFQDVIEQMMQLAQAVLQAENESMRSAIQV